MKYLYCMSQANKNANKSFLDRFEGRAVKVSKAGMQDVLNPIKMQKKLEHHQIDHQFRKVDLDALIPSNPERHSAKINNDNIVKRRDSLGKPPIKSSIKQDYVPSAFTPQTSSKQQSVLSNYPPSRSLSNSTNNSRHKYMFGKYLKLDKQALSHIDFLQSVQQKSFFKKNKGQSINLN